MINNRYTAVGTQGYINSNRTKIAQSLWKAMEAGQSPTRENWEAIKGQVGLYYSEQFRVEHIEDIFGSFENALAYASERNHRIVSAEFSHYEDVYDIEVSGAHNFVIVNPENTTGIFVSNSRVRRIQGTSTPSPSPRLVTAG